jgi:NAD(P)-dependent dehydrogenase (short-subunit alcohol dehydrogenase family)
VGVAIVTGGSRGIGAAIVGALADAGFDIVFSYHANESAARALASRTSAAHVRVDVADEADILQLFARADARGELMVLVNNAGIVAPRARVDELDVARIERMLAVNTLGPFLCAREAVRRMSTAHGGNGGVIVNVGSVASRLGSGGQYVDYAASKAAVDTLTLGLAAETAREGIRVSCIRPGIIDTDIHASGGEPDRAQQLADSIPMGRPGRPEEVASLVRWLCSEEATYVTGAIFDVSGGR